MLGRASRWLMFTSSMSQSALIKTFSRSVASGWQLRGRQVAFIA